MSYSVYGIQNYDGKNYDPDVGDVDLRYEVLNNYVLLNSGEGPIDRAIDVSGYGGFAIFIDPRMAINKLLVGSKPLYTDVNNGLIMGNIDWNPNSDPHYKTILKSSDKSMMAPVFYYDKWANGESVANMPGGVLIFTTRGASSISLDIDILGFEGTSSPDTLTGNYLDNLFAGKDGDDTLIGGGGLDTAVYTGNYADYTITYNSNGSVTVTDNLGIQGSDTLWGIENLFFYDRQQSLHISPTNNIPTLATPTALFLSDTSSADIFVKQTGTLSATDIDGDKLIYGIDGGKNGVKAGNYGTLKVNSKTGDYTYTPNAKTIEALSADTTETFTITVKDKASTATANLIINLTGAIDTRIGTEANDKLKGTEGIDIITGAGGSDNLLGLGGNDSLDGGNGNDKLNGGNGDDRLTGGGGADILTGGKGNDTFVFSVLTVSADADKILDFTHGDKLEFITSIFTKLEGATAANFVSGQTSVDGDDYLIYDSKTGKLYYDADGSGTGSEAILITGIKGNDAKTLSIDDFSFV